GLVVWEGWGGWVGAVGSGEDGSVRRREGRLCQEHSAKLVPVGRVGDASQVLDEQGTCVVFISTLPRCHRILFPTPTPAQRAPESGGWGGGGPGCSCSGGGGGGAVGVAAALVFPRRLLSPTARGWLRGLAAAGLARGASAPVWPGPPGPPPPSRDLPAPPGH